jgi:hypothetical protein
MVPSEQCEQCRHSKMMDGQLRCRVRLQQMCRIRDDLQSLEMVPGLCYILNPDSNCPDYSPKLSVRFGVFQRGGKKEAPEEKD